MRKNQKPSLPESVRDMTKESFVRYSMSAIVVAYWLGVFVALFGGIVHGQSFILMAISFIYLLHAAVWMIYRAHLKKIDEAPPDGLRASIKEAPFFSYSDSTFRKLSRIGILISAVFWLAVPFSI